jgi:hypothetical protein
MFQLADRPDDLFSFFDPLGVCFWGVTRLSDVVDCIRHGGYYLGEDGRPSARWMGQGEREIGTLWLQQAPTF